MDFVRFKPPTEHQTLMGGLAMTGQCKQRPLPIRMSYVNYVTWTLFLIHTLKILINKMFPPCGT